MHIIMRKMNQEPKNVPRGEGEPPRRPTEWRAVIVYFRMNEIIFENVDSVRNNIEQLEKLRNNITEKGRFKKHSGKN